MERKHFVFFSILFFSLLLSSCGNRNLTSPKTSSQSIAPSPEITVSAIPKSPSPDIPSPDIPSPEYDDTSIVLFRCSVIDSLSGSFGEDFTIDEDRENCVLTVSFWPSGSLDLAESASSGDVESVIKWSDVESATSDLSSSFRDIADMLELSHYTIICNVLSDFDHDTILLSFSDRDLLFDYVPSDISENALNSSSEYAFASDEEKYNAADAAFRSYVENHPGAVCGTVLNFDFSPSGHPYFSVTVNYYDGYDSVYEFQSLVCSTLDELSRISSDYYVHYDSISIFFRYGEYGSESSSSYYIEYRVREPDIDLFFGTITDECNHVSGYDIPSDQINAWYAGSEFSEKASVADAPCTYDEYLQIEDGMSYVDVVGVIGSEGIELSSSSSYGATVSVYQWDGSKKHSNVVVEFVNDEVVAKSQSGLS